MELWRVKLCVITSLRLLISSLWRVLSLLEGDGSEENDLDVAGEETFPLSDIEGEELLPCETSLDKQHASFWHRVCEC